jgi:hypothetical protein
MPAREQTDDRHGIRNAHAPIMIDSPTCHSCQQRTRNQARCVQTDAECHQRTKPKQAYHADDPLDSSETSGSNVEGMENRQTNDHDDRRGGETNPMPNWILRRGLL